MSDSSSSSDSGDEKRERGGSRAREGEGERKRRHDSSPDRRETESKRRPRSRSRSRDRDRRSRSRSRRRSPDKRREGRSRSREQGRRRRSRSGERSKNEGVEPALPAKKKDELLTTKTGGAYIPPAKLRMMQKNITDKSSEAYQRLAWEALKKSINGLINKVNSPNIAVIVRELFAENIVRGRGLLCQSIIQAQTASPTFTHVYAALAAIINTKFPNIGELLLKRLILNFKRGFKRNDKTRCTSSVRFIAHMVNQQVAHEVLSLEILTLLLENPTDDSAEVAITFLKEVGQKLSEVSPRGIHAIFERLRHVLHESTLDKRTQYMIEVMFQVRKDGFKDNPSIAEELDLVEEDDQYTHMITLDDATGGEEILNVFKFDGEYETNEEKYGAIKTELLGDDSGGSSGSDGSGSDSSDDDDDEEEGKKETIVDATETNLISLRRTIYLTIQSALDFEEAVHKLNKLNLKPGQEQELCHMIIDCCAQQRTYEKFFGLMGQRFCQVNKLYVEPFMKIFVDTYNTVHRLETGKLRNVGKFFSHLFHTDSIGWEVFQVIKLNEDDTTSSSRIFIKILFQELAEFLGMNKLVERSRDASMAEAWEGLMPRDNPRDTRFAINFFTSIGLGALTEDLRAHLKNAPKPVAVVAPMTRGQESSSDSSSSSDSDSSDSESSDSEDERRKRKEKKRSSGHRKPDEKKRSRRDSRSRSQSDERRRRRRRSEEDERSRRRDHHDRKQHRDSDSSDNERSKRREEYDRRKRHNSGSSDDGRRKRREDYDRRKRQDSESSDDGRRKRREDERRKRHDSGSSDDGRSKRREDHERRKRYGSESSDDDRRKRREDHDRRKRHDSDSSEDERRPRKKDRRDRERDEMYIKKEKEDDRDRRRDERDRSGERQRKRSRERQRRERSLSAGDGRRRR